MEALGQSAFAVVCAGFLAAFIATPIALMTDADQWFDILWGGYCVAVGGGLLVVVAFAMSVFSSAHQPLRTVVDLDFAQPLDSA